MILDLRALGPAYRLMHLFITSANSEGWVRYGQPLTELQLAAAAGVPGRTLRRWLARMREGGFIETENYVGRGLKIRIAAELRSHPFQMPLFNGPQLVWKSSEKVRKTP